jgi:hypothetical protein
VALVGTLIAESVRVGSTLQGIPLTVAKVSRADLGDVEAGQPRTWTLLEFEAADADADRLANALGEVLDARGWYCDFHTDDETFIVFAGRIFRYPNHDPAGRAEAAAYGRSVGVPEAQLDWPS